MFDVCLGANKIQNFAKFKKLFNYLCSVYIYIMQIVSLLMNFEIGKKTKSIQTV